MWPNLQETAGLVTFTEDILNGKLHFLCSDKPWIYQTNFREKSFNLLDTKLVVNNGMYEAQLYGREIKNLIICNSSIPKRCKRDEISVDLHWPKQILSKFDMKA